jgi:hypothetical protein
MLLAMIRTECLLLVEHETELGFQLEGSLNLYDQSCHWARLIYESYSYFLIVALQK